MKLIFQFLLAAYSLSLGANEVIYSGSVHSDGTPTPPIPLVLHDKYQIRVTGVTNLGKFVQNREKLANDACFEFGVERAAEKISSFRNSSDISVCDGQYHPDHIYQSEVFSANQNKIHFWVYDTDYEDNHGEFKVEVIHIK